LKGRQNSYDFVRFCAASAVLFSHHFGLNKLPEPPVSLYGETFGKLAVEVFFCLSGYLICQSLQVDSSWQRFVSARVLRIFPNLAFALIGTSLITLVWYQNYANLLDHGKYVLRNLLMFIFGVRFEISGVFGDLDWPTVNGSLWSLPYELWLYVLLFAVFLVTNFRIAIIVVVIALGIGWAVTPETSFVTFQFCRLGSFFFAGSLLAIYWNPSPISGAVALLSLILIVRLPIETPLHSIALAITVIGLGSSPVMAWFSKGGDASYGMYIFAWPVQQFSILLVHSFWWSMVAAFVVTTMLGYFTWHTFEKPIMAKRNIVAMMLQKLKLRKSLNA
jgi:peptidoglycan/LPS O-acetylase OafA/YrhL